MVQNVKAAVSQLHDTITIASGHSLALRRTSHHHRPTYPKVWPLLPPVEGVAGTAGCARGCFARFFFFAEADYPVLTGERKSVFFFFFSCFKTNCSCTHACWATQEPVVTFFESLNDAHPLVVATDYIMGTSDCEKTREEQQQQQLYTEASPCCVVDNAYRLTAPSV